MENKSNIFICKGDIDKISCHSHDPYTNKIINKLEKSENKIYLKDIKEEIISGPMGFQLHTTDYVLQDYPNSVWLLQILNLGKSGNLLRTKYDKFIPKEKDEELKKSRVKKGDIIIAKTGAIDRCVLIKEDLQANLNQALGIIRLKSEYTGINIIPEYVYEFLNSKYGMAQLMRLGGYRAGQSGLSLDEIGSVSLILPNESEQKKIINEVNKIKESSNGVLLKYKECLVKIDLLLEESLKINKKSFKKTFILSSKEILDRIDYYFYSPERVTIRKEIQNADKFAFQVIDGKELNIIKQMGNEEIEKRSTHLFKYVDIGNTEKDLGEIEDYEEDIPMNLPLRARQLVKANDILLPRPTGSNEGIIIVPEEFNDNLFSTGFIQIRPQDKNQSFLLWIILRSKLIQKQLFYLQSGSIQPEVTPDNFKEYISLPIPKGEIKDKIISQAEDLIKKAKNYRDEYDLILKKTQEKFIELLDL